MANDEWKQPTQEAIALLRSKYSDAFFESQGLELDLFLSLVRDEEGHDNLDKALALAIGLENAALLLLAKFHRETGKPVDTILQELALTLE